jgi:hypothetical protein
VAVSFIGGGNRSTRRGDMHDLKNCRLLWDVLKVEIREITMRFSKIKAKETRELTRTLEKTLEAKLACR